MAQITLDLGDGGSADGRGRGEREDKKEKTRKQKDDQGRRQCKESAGGWREWCAYVCVGAPIYGGATRRAGEPAGAPIW